MIDHFVDWFQIFPTWMATFLIAMLPLGELRASIPIAMSVYDLSPWGSFFWSVLGNMTPVVVILWLLNPVSGFLRKHFKIFDKFFNWLFSWTRKRHTSKFEKWGALALITLVAIPLPVTGGWTGALAAYVFGIPFKKAVPLILVGVIIAGVIVTAATLGVFSFI